MGYQAQPRPGGNAGNRKDVCVKEAKAELVKDKAGAKVDRITTHARQDAATKQADARNEAKSDTRDAEYKVPLEKCDALAGPAKETCASNAETAHRKH